MQQVKNLGKTLTELDYEILNAIYDLEKVSQSISSIVVKTEKSLNFLFSLDQDRKKTVLEGLRNYIKVLSFKSFFPSTEDETLEIGDEIECVTWALNEYGFCTFDDDYSFIDSGDIIEAYVATGIQIYRNYELLKVNIFDILTLLSHEWPNLYQRSSLVNDQIQECIQQVMISDSTSAVPFNVPRHQLKAINGDSSEEIVAEINLKFIKPLYSKKTFKKVGFIATQKNSPIIFSGKEASVLHHI